VLAGTIAILCYAMILIGIAIIPKTSPVELSSPGTPMLAFINDSCEMGVFSTMNSSNDPFSLNLNSWRQKRTMCSKAWIENYSLEWRIVLAVVQDKVDESLNLLNTSVEEIFTVYMVVLMTYSNPAPSFVTSLVEFCVALPRKDLRLYAYQSILSRLVSFNDLPSFALLKLNYVLSREEGKEFSLILERSKYSINSVISKICKEIKQYSSSPGKTEIIETKIFSTLSTQVQKFYMPTFAEKCFLESTDPVGKNATIALTHHLSGNGVKCVFFKYLFKRLQGRHDLDTNLAGEVAEESEKIVESGNVFSQEDIKACELVADEMKKHTLKSVKNGVYLRNFDSQSWKIFKRTDQLFLTNLFPHLIKERYGGNSKNGTKLIRLFLNWKQWLLSSKDKCEAGRLLAEAMKNYGRLNSFEFFSLFIQMQPEVYKPPMDCVNVSYAPGWMSLIFPQVKKPQETIRAKSAVLELSSILSGIQSRDETSASNYEILFINFAIKSLQNESTDKLVLQNMSRLATSTEPLLNLTLAEIKMQSMVDYKYLPNFFIKIYEFYDHSVLRFFLQQVLQWLDEIDIGKFILELHVHIDDDYCFIWHALYLELKNRSEDDSIKAFLLSTFVEHSLKYKNYWFRIRDPPVDKSWCLQVVENLSNVTQKHVAPFERLYLSDDQVSVEELADWLESYYDGALWFLPKLFERIDMNTSEDADKMLNFLEHLTQEYHQNTCPGFETLLDKMDKVNLDKTATCETIKLAIKGFNYEIIDYPRFQEMPFICFDAKAKYCK